MDTFQRNTLGRLSYPVTFPVRSFLLEDVGNSVLMGDGIGAFAMEFVPEQKQQISFTLSNFPDTEFSLVNYDSGYRPVPGKPDGMVMAGTKLRNSV